MILPKELSIGLTYIKMRFNPQLKKGMPPKKAKKPLKRSPIRKKFKKSGELEIFKEIWKERPHICQVTGLPIHEFNVMCFSHVVMKSLAKKLRLDKRNIWLVLPSIHVEWENGDRNQPKFDKKRELFEQLRREDNANNQLK